MKEKDGPLFILEAIDMIDIVGLDIEINRGDSAGLTFHFEGDDVPANGTTMLFQVRPAVNYKYSVL